MIENSEQGLPLVDLHRHLDGNIRPHIIWKLAQQNKIPLPVDSLPELVSLTTIKDRTSDLMQFLQKLDYGVSVLANVEACYQVAYDNVVSAKSEGLDYTELRFSPHFMAKKYKLAMKDVVRAVVQGVKDGNRTFGTDYQLIGILSRTFGVEACQQELQAILSQASEFVGLDLAGDEKGYPAKLFVNHFKQARDHGLHITVHAGEAAGPESVWDAINLLGAERIGHGVAVAQDHKLIDYMLMHDIGIESCLTSNYQTGTWTQLSTHPLRQFLDLGLSVSLNTDDPAISNITIQDEYELAKQVLGLNTSQLATLKRNGCHQIFRKN
jgi:adenosine deaminase